MGRLRQRDEEHRQRAFEAAQARVAAAQASAPRPVTSMTFPDVKSRLHDVTESLEERQRAVKLGREDGEDSNWCKYSRPHLSFGGQPVRSSARASLTAAPSAGRALSAMSNLFFPRKN